MLLGTAYHRRISWLTITKSPPMFLVSVASKGLRVHVSALESTLAGISISVDSKWVRGGMISRRSEDRPLHAERIRRSWEAWECAAMGPVGAPVVGLVGEPDPHRSEDRPLHA